MIASSQRPGDVDMGYRKELNQPGAALIGEAMAFPEATAARRAMGVVAAFGVRKTGCCAPPCPAAGATPASAGRRGYL